VIVVVAVSALVAPNKKQKLKPIFKTKSFTVLYKIQIFHG
jgi:hypothetical protein